MMGGGGDAEAWPGSTLPLSAMLALLCFLARSCFSFSFSFLFPLTWISIVTAL